MYRFAGITIVALVIACPVVANDADPAKLLYDAQGAFEAMQGLEGLWTGEAIVVQVGQAKEDGVKSNTTVRYETLANGSSIFATFAEDTPMEMVSVFHQDGPDKLIHTHYCAVGNQPSMAFEPSDEPGAITFKFTHGTNMDVDEDGHVHHTTLRIIDENKIETETDLWRDGKLSAIRYTTMKRESGSASTD